MTLTELRYIVAVSQKNHFGKAAQACFVSQPTLSIAIKKLEEELGVCLFERSSKNEIRITDIGQQVIDQAHIVLQQAQILIEIAQQGKDPLSGQFKLGVIYTIGPYLLPSLIPKLRQTAPDLKLIIEENFTPTCSTRSSRARSTPSSFPIPSQNPVSKPRRFTRNRSWSHCRVTTSGKNARIFARTSSHPRI
jgi:LysR family hydrogen peroxide-inducible transcriptional activator